LFFSCCDSVAVHFTHHATPQRAVPQAQAGCLNLRRIKRKVTATGIGLSTTTNYMQQSTSGAAGNGLFTTTNYLRGAAGIGLGTTQRFFAAGVSRLFKYASTTPRGYGRRHRSLHHACDAQRAPPRATDRTPR
jgi:hypothetical protein